MNTPIDSKYIYNNGFSDRVYLCTNCGSHKLIMKINKNDGMIPPTYKCDECEVVSHSPKWSDINDKRMGRLVTSVIALGFVPKSAFIHNYQINYSEIPDGTSVEYLWLCDVQKWLRENYNINAISYPSAHFINKYCALVINNLNLKYDDEIKHDSYEDALISALNEAIKIINRNNKNTVAKIYTKKDEDQLSNMQYYMEYCESNGYVTPQDWLENYKHF